MSDAFWIGFWATLTPTAVLIVTAVIKWLGDRRRDNLAKDAAKFVAQVAADAKVTAEHVVVVKDTLAADRIATNGKLDHIEFLVNSAAEQARAEIRQLKGELLLRLDEIVVLKAMLGARRKEDQAALARLEAERPKGVQPHINEDAGADDTPSASAAGSGPKAPAPAME